MHMLCVRIKKANNQASSNTHGQTINIKFMLRYVTLCYVMLCKSTVKYFLVRILDFFLTSIYLLAAKQQCNTLLLAPRITLDDW